VFNLKLLGDHCYSMKNWKRVLGTTNLWNPSHNQISRALHRGRRFSYRECAHSAGECAHSPEKKKRLHLFIMEINGDVYIYVCIYIYISIRKSCTPQSFCPQPRCRVASHVPGPRQHYLRMLQNRIPACKDRQNNMH